ncbi:hypothetical protein VTI74DRAFT_7830 [Chaetomium olivicolor]
MAEMKVWDQWVSHHTFLLPPGSLPQPHPRPGPLPETARCRSRRLRHLHAPARHHLYPAQRLQVPALRQRRVAARVSCGAHQRALRQQGHDAAARRRPRRRVARLRAQGLDGGLQRARHAPPQGYLGRGCRRVPARALGGEEGWVGVSSFQRRPQDLHWTAVCADRGQLRDGEAAAAVRQDGEPARGRGDKT